MAMSFEEEVKKYLLGLSVEYALDETKVNKLTDILYQAGARDIDRVEDISLFIFNNNLFERPEDEIMDELRKNNFC